MDSQINYQHPILSCDAAEEISKIEESGVQLADASKYIEKTNLSVLKSPREIMQALNAYFINCSFQADIDIVGFKITCLGIIYYEMLKFVVKLYEGKEGHVIVEFQRRIGSIESFYSIFRDAEQLLQRNMLDSSETQRFHQSALHLKIEKSLEDNFPISDKCVRMLCRQIDEGQPPSVNFALKRLGELNEMSLDMLEYELVMTTLSAKVKWLANMTGEEFIHVTTFATMVSLLSSLSKSNNKHHSDWLQEQTETLLNFIKSSAAFSSLEQRVLYQYLSAAAALMLKVD